MRGKLGGPPRRPALIEGDELGRKPRLDRAIVSMVAFTVFFVFVMAIVLAVDRVEDTTSAGAAQLLTERGYDPSGLRFDANHRNVEVQGLLPAGLTADELVHILEDEPGNFPSDGDVDIRTADVLAREARTNAPGLLFISVVLEDGTMSLSGSVNLQSQRSELTDAAQRASGPSTIASNITVSGVTNSSDGADAVEDLSTLLAAFDGSISAANLELSDVGISGSIEVTDVTARERLQTLAGERVVISSPKVLGRLQATVFFGDGQIILDGEVLTIEQMELLEEAAQQVAGEDAVISNLTALALPPEIDGADEKVRKVAEIITLFGGLSTADLRFDDSDLTVSGASLDTNAAVALQQAVTDARSVGLRPAFSIATPNQEPLTEADSLNFELTQIEDDLQESLRFEADSADFANDAVGALGRLVELLSIYDRAGLLLEGHTDSLGDAAANLDLSRRRADAVVELLVGLGIDESRLQASGAGESNPIAPNSSEDGRRANRRIEFRAFNL